MSINILMVFLYLKDEDEALDEKIHEKTLER
jgi:hypothetical protein